MLMVSKFDHCLVDLVYRWRIGEMPMEITAIVSNHPRETYAHIDLEGIPFHHLPVTKETKMEQEAAIWALVRDPARGNCVRCHAPNAATPQSPFFASADPAEAYAAAQAKINLDDPLKSRLYVRLKEENHNCWPPSCDASAAAMLAQINAFVDNVPATEVDANLVLSKALTLYDGTVAAGGNRYETNTIAKYEFKIPGTTMFDR
jgi:hypothetical protein